MYDNPDNPLNQKQETLGEGYGPELLLTWYRVVKRDLPWRRTRDPYSIWVSEVMLQQTQVKTVIPYYEAFLERFPTVRHLAEASLEEVLEMWRGLGYYSRAKNLWKGARYVVETWTGKLPEGYELLLKIPGVGEYTAGAVASIAFGERVPAVDGNVKRVLARFLAWGKAVESAQTRRFFLELLKVWQPKEAAGDFNQAMMELGATVCTPKAPKCLECPLQEGCQGFQLGTPLFFPVKTSKEKVTEALRPTLILVKEGKVLLKRRPAEGLLANLWEFPGEELMIERGYQLSERDLEDRVRKTLNLQEDFRVNGPIVHTFSHRRWKIFWAILDCGQGEGIEVETEIMRNIGTDRIRSVETDRLRDTEIDRVRDRESDFEMSRFVGTGEQGELRWVTEKEMEKIALPVAFQKVWTEVKSTLLTDPEETD